MCQHKLPTTTLTLSNSFSPRWLKRMQLAHARPIMSCIHLTLQLSIQSIVHYSLHKLPSVGCKQKVDTVVFKFHLLVEVAVNLMTNCSSAVWVTIVCGTGTLQVGDDDVMQYKGLASI